MCAHMLVTSIPRTLRDTLLSHVYFVFEDDDNTVEPRQFLRLCLAVHGSAKTYLTTFRGLFDSLSRPMDNFPILGPKESLPSSLRGKWRDMEYSVRSTTSYSIPKILPLAWKDVSTLWLSASTERTLVPITLPRSSPNNFNSPHKILYNTRKPF